MSDGPPGMPQRAPRALSGVATTAALAVAVAAIVTWPAWRFSLGAPAGAIDFVGASDGEQYLTQIRHAADGRFGHANDLLAEWSTGPGRDAPILLRLLGAVVGATGATVHTVNVWATALGAAAQFLLVFATARALRLAAVTSRAAALAACLAPFLWSFHGAELWLFHPDRTSIDFLPLWRPVNPSLSSVALWGFVLALIRWFEEPTVRRWLVVMLAGGLAASVYLALLAFVAGLGGAAVAVLLVEGRWKAALALAVPGLVAVAPKIGDILAWNAAATADPAKAEVLAGNLNFVASSDPILTANVATSLCAAVAALLLHLRKRLGTGALLVTVGAPLVLLALFNEQLVTGRLHQPFHYDWFYTVPFVWLTGAVIAERVAPTLGSRIASAMRRAEVRRRVAIGLSSAAAIAVLIAASGRAGGTILHAVGAIRAETLVRPGLFAALGVGGAASAWIAAELLRTGRERIVGAACCTLVAAVAVVEGVRIQDHGFVARAWRHAEVQQIAPAVSYMRERAEPGSVIACADGDLPRLFTSRADCRVLISVEVMFYNAPDESEHLARRLVWLALYGITREELAAGLPDGGRFHADIFKWRAFGALPSKLAFLTGGGNPNPLPPDAADRVLAEYDRVLATPRDDLLRRFRLDYVLWTAADAKRGFRDPGPAFGLTPVVTSPDCRLYRVPASR